MKKPWQTYFGTRIHRSPNGVEIYQNLFFRWLTFGSSAIQTLNYRYQPAKANLAYVKFLTVAARFQIGKTCLLGLGGAGVAHVLAPYLLDESIDAVEKNAEVIELATKYFMIQEIKNLNVIHQDAAIYIQNTTTKYQHILVDLFNANSFPRHCNNLNFIESCQQSLLPNGVLAINVANLHEQESIFHYMRQQFKHCTVVLPVAKTTNVIILGYNGSSLNSFLTLLSHNIKKLTWDTKWGCIAHYA